MTERRGDRELADVMRRALVDGYIDVHTGMGGNPFLGMDYGTIDLTEDEAQACEEAQRGE